MTLLLSLLLAADDAHAARLERLDFGIAGSLRAGDPAYLTHPIELSVTSFALPWLAFEGRVGIAPMWSSAYFYLPDGDARALLSTGVRFGKEKGPYGAVGVVAWFYDEDYDGWSKHYRGDPFDWYGLAARGGWRFPMSKASYVSPELYVGTYYVGGGVQFEWVAIRK